MHGLLLYVVFDDFLQLWDRTTCNLESKGTPNYVPNQPNQALRSVSQQHHPYFHAQTGPCGHFVKKFPLLIEIFNTDYATFPKDCKTGMLSAITLIYTNFTTSKLLSQDNNCISSNDHTLIIIMYIGILWYIKHFRIYHHSLRIF